MKNATLALGLTAALLAGCDRKEAAKPAPEPPAKAEADAPPSAAPDPKPAFAAPDPFRTAIGKVYAGYLQIESSLAHDDLAGAKSAFDPMHVVLHTLPKEGMDPAALAEWDSLDARLMKVLHPMAASQDLAAMREHLADFTPLMLEALGKFGAKGADPAFLFHCPMARNNQGADWLQKDKALQNPFYGKSMLKCGNLVKEVRL